MTPDYALFGRMMSTAAANWEVAYRTTTTIAANTTAGMMRMAETAAWVTTPAPTGEPLDVDVPQEAPVNVDG